MGGRNIVCADLTGCHMSKCICEKSLKVCALHGVLIVYCILGNILIKTMDPLFSNVSLHKGTSK